MLSNNRKHKNDVSEISNYIPLNNRKFITPQQN